MVDSLQTQDRNKTKFSNNIFLKLLFFICLIKKYIDKRKRNKNKVSTLIIVSITFSGTNKAMKIKAKKCFVSFLENVENIRYSIDMEKLPKRILISVR